MKTYLDALALLQSLTNEKLSIHAGCGNKSIHGLCIFYTFNEIGADKFYKVLNKKYMKNTYHNYSINDIHDSYTCYILPDDSLINIPDNIEYGAWVTIPIKNS